MFEVGCLSTIALLIGALGYLVTKFIAETAVERKSQKDAIASMECREKMFNTWLNDCAIEKRGKRK